MPWSVVGADRVPQVVVRGSRRQELPEDLAGVPRRRQEAEGGKAARSARRSATRSATRPTFTYPFLWSCGGQEVDAKGKVVLEFEGDRSSRCKFMTQFWKDAHDEGGLAWDDTQQQPRLPLRHICAYAERRLDLRRGAQQAPTSSRPRRARRCTTDILHSPLPTGPKGQHGYHTRSIHMVMKYSKNRRRRTSSCKWVAQEGELREVVHRRRRASRSAPTEGLGEAQDVGRGSGDGAVQDRARKLQKPLAGLRRPAEPKAAEAWNKYIVTEMYAQGGAGADEAGGGGEVGGGRVGKIYTGT